MRIGGGFKHGCESSGGAWTKSINRRRTERAVHKSHATWFGPLCTASIDFGH